MDGDPGAAVNAAILSKISGKSALNQQVFDNTFSVFNALKETKCPRNWTTDSKRWGTK